MAFPTQKRSAYQQSMCRFVTAVSKKKCSFLKQVCIYVYSSPKFTHAVSQISNDLTIRYGTQQGEKLIDNTRKILQLHIGSYGHFNQVFLAPRDILKAFKASRKAFSISALPGSILKPPRNASHAFSYSFRNI